MRPDNIAIEASRQKHQKLDAHAMRDLDSNIYASISGQKGAPGPECKDGESFLKMV
jgi:hypothetical protein